MKTFARKSRARFSLRLAALVVLVALPVSADAPTGQYEQFDKDVTVISDHFTKLAWERRPAAKGVVFAAVTCESGFRLPTVKELVTLVDEEPHLEYEFGANVAKMIDQLAFRDTDVKYPYWTQTPGTGKDQGKHWAVNFATGTTSLLADASPGNYRCVK